MENLMAVSNPAQYAALIRRYFAACNAGDY